jgi:alkanesulfonate monooxygenase SsuD/methylene tetrahydromethanopterin reductase-like flavin-dependent oxidoreductase (luciferase family)
MDRCNIERMALGYHSTFTTEHRFIDLGQIFASFNLVTYLMVETTPLRLCSTIMTLSWHNWRSKRPPSI